MGLPNLDSAISPGLGQRINAIGGVPGEVPRCLHGVRSALYAFCLAGIGVRILLREFRWDFVALAIILLVLFVDAASTLLPSHAERLRLSRRARAECNGPGIVPLP